MFSIPEQSNGLEPIEQQIERLPNATRRLAAQLRLPLEIE
ncbi:MAG TPA: oligoketide cyclase, partial [Synechococcales bacterium UBA8647]|nr:oligoketide cyclase [Synechococcales bacterium UBA8647]